MTTTTPPTRHRTTPAALHLTRAYDWRDDAACRGIQDDLFFPPACSTRGWKAQELEAKALCARCPVQADCLEYALDAGLTTGVWGGLSESERKPLHAAPQTSVGRCWDAQEWIEEQIEAGVGQRTIAQKLRVSRSTLSRVLRQFEAERQQSMQVVKAA